MLELRVLTGTHAGARALLSAEPQWIGSGDECALILTDEGLLGQHACLEHAPDGTWVLRWPDAREPPVVLRPGVSAWVGPVRIAVETLGTPWRDDLPVATPIAPAAPEAEPGPAQTLRSSSTGTWRRVCAAVIVVAILGAGLVIAWPRVQAALAPEAPAPQTARAPDEPLPGVIARLGLRERVTLDLSDPQRAIAKAVFLSEQESEALAQALSRRTPRPHLEWVDEAQAVRQVVQQVQRVGEPLGAKLDVRYLGGGRFRVEGQVADESQRSQLATDLKDMLPQVVEFEFAMQARTELARAMVDELKRLGIAQLQGRWSEGVLVMDVRLPPGGLAQWERALLSAAASYEVPFRATVLGAAMAAGGPSTPPPFRLRSVVSTPQPYVILSDGRKLALGGEIAGWRLVGIDRQAVRFEGPEGQAISMER